MYKHTVGPLEYGHTKEIPGVRTIKGWYIRPKGVGQDLGEVYLTASQDPEVQEANARLWACSPDLFKAVVAGYALSMDGTAYKDCSPAEQRFRRLALHALTKMGYIHDDQDDTPEQEETNA